MAANEAAIEMRRSAKQREEEEVESILAYQAMKVDMLSQEISIVILSKYRTPKERKERLRLHPMTPQILTTMKAFLCIMGGTLSELVPGRASDLWVGSLRNMGLKVLARCGLCETL